MIDVEVIRLRQLRRAALMTRQLAKTMSATLQSDSAFSRSAVAAWSIARLINGRLGAHPNLSCQQGANALHTTVDGALASITGWVALKQRKSHTVFAQQLQLLSRALNDTRALTWSADLSDDLGRAQWHLLRLQQELSAGVMQEQGFQTESRAEVAGSDGNRPADWPYLAI
jgi:hypothetical protein